MKSTEHRRTRHFNIMLAVLAAAGLIAVLIAIDPMARASQTSHHGWSGHHGIQGAGKVFCENSNENELEQMGAYMKSWLNLDAAQQTSWGRVERELGRGLESLRDACGRFAAGGTPSTMPERLALMESAMEAGAEALRAVRPAFVEFYGMLDEDQRGKIDEISSRRNFGIR